MGGSSKTVNQSRVEMTELVLPQFTNAHRQLFGGQLVCWIDICGAVAAQRHACAYVVTASIDAVHFIHPVNEGDTVVLRGQVNAAFRTSMECGVSVWTEDRFTGERRRVGKAYSTFVALGADGNPTPIPELIAESDDDLRRQRDAETRRVRRLDSRRATAKAAP